MIECDGQVRVVAGDKKFKGVAVKEREKKKENRGSGDTKREGQSEEMAQSKVSVGDKKGRCGGRLASEKERLSVYTEVQLEEWEEVKDRRGCWQEIKEVNGGGGCGARGG